MNRFLVKALVAGTIFTSAFLLFLVQPMIAKQILPWFGGSAAVWSVCMVFFQVALLAGYAYSDWITRHLRVRVQAALHVGLLIASLTFLPIVTSTRWKPAGTEDPTLQILGLLLATIGLPYFLLSTTGPLVQSWIARTPLGSQVYRYFSLSNLASLASLLAYPVLIEPRSELLQQAWGWSLGYLMFVLLCTGMALYMARHWDETALGATAAAVSTTTETQTPPRPGDYLLWLTLPALGSWLLLAITNHITQNVAAIPFLWVLPLSVYLLSFVLCFESDRWYRRSVFLPLAATMLALCAYGLQSSLGVYIKTAIPLYVAGLFVLCMFLHGEMARLRPTTRWLTRFYLMLSLGGALGGVSVGLVAPHLLPAYYELGVGLVLVALAGIALLRNSRIGMAAALSLAVLSAWFLAEQVRGDLSDTRRLSRNFYGTLMTLDTQRDNAEDNVRQMYHGSIKHGEQYLAHDRRRTPTAYFGPDSGIGHALAAAPQKPRRVGVIGLGVGTLASYGRVGDVYRMYEINPQVFELADTEFSFLADSSARIERILGDARLALERESPQGYDVLAVDAFSGDAVPMHLITLQAMDVYWRHMTPDGVVAFNVTNRRIALAPVIEQIAKARGLHVVLVHDEAEHTPFRATDWMLVARNPSLLAPEVIGVEPTAIPPNPELKRPWTDDFNNLFVILR
ncbi:fused MFS/spermidine synthase [Variovorax sp. J22R133]|uniref:fused MFS/spermidine synthase n=1 Tax=Variovorax brevis TaxID=3053503 RepID=UPI002576A7BE|nr:fused MFS/spermidine synthase [Variovorax sp. J22R133]MDM0116826.1 fused MFS/spermidine synthase [Variovorax sp. J22R133]